MSKYFTEIRQYDVLSGDKPMLYISTYTKILKWSDTTAVKIIQMGSAYGQKSIVDFMQESNNAILLSKYKINRCRGVCIKNATGYIIMDLLEPVNWGKVSLQQVIICLHTFHGICSHNNLLAKNIMWDPRKKQLAIINYDSAKIYVQNNLDTISQAIVFIDKSIEHAMNIYNDWLTICKELPYDKFSVKYLISTGIKLSIIILEKVGDRVNKFSNSDTLTPDVIMERFHLTMGVRKLCENIKNLKSRLIDNSGKDLQ